jgi:glycosyltransferase involved in cell wall biosynthesis
LVDVVIPTFNCATHLETCLDRLDAQRGRDRTRLLIVDGGSSDNTLEVARRHGAEIAVHPGQYGTGRNGARHFGECQGRAPFVWYLDSDNHLVEEGVLDDLLAPLLTDVSINMAIPLTAVDTRSSPFCRWLARAEIERLERAARNGHREDAGWVVPDLDYGLPNAVLIRREAMEAVGGYDSDVRMLIRLRERGLARAAIVRSAHYFHQEANSASHYWRKMERRVQFFGRLTDSELKAFFLEYPINPHDHPALVSVTIRDRLEAPLISLREYWHSGETDWLYGLVYPALFAGLVLRHPRLSRRVLSDLI